jgi:hypothetical protein
MKTKQLPPRADDVDDYLVKMEAAERSLGVLCRGLRLAVVVEDQEDCSCREGSPSLSPCRPFCKELLVGPLYRSWNPAATRRKIKTLLRYTVPKAQPH